MCHILANQIDGTVLEKYYSEWIESRNELSWNKLSKYQFRGALIFSVTEFEEKDSKYYFSSTTVVSKEVQSVHAKCQENIVVLNKWRVLTWETLTFSFLLIEVSWYCYRLLPIFFEFILRIVCRISLSTLYSIWWHYQTLITLRKCTLVYHIQYAMLSIGMFFAILIETFPSVIMIWWIIIILSWYRFLK